jgi:ligand-binding sensor domain-containing protein
MRIVRILGITAAVYILLAAAFGGVTNWLQPALDGTIALRTVDADGQAHVQRLAVSRKGDELWVASGNHFRGWYYRTRQNPNVEVITDGETTRYVAVPIDDPGEVARYREEVRARMGSPAYYASRALLLFAGLKPVRLDPQP